MKDPTKLPALLDAVSTEVSYIRHESLGAGSVDESLYLLFNLIAMTCLYAAMIGNTLAISNQANPVRSGCQTQCLAGSPAACHPR